MFLQNEEEGYIQELLAINYDNPDQFQILAIAGQYFQVFGFHQIEHINRSSFEGFKIIVSI